jgi:F-type H+-transporting ATPase subunit delta
MADKETVARPYARAAFDIAVKQNQLQQWSQMLTVAAIIVDDEKVYPKLSNPASSASERAGLVNNLASDYFNEDMKHLVYLLAENKRLPLLSDIMTHFERYRLSQQSIIQVKVFTAMEINEQQRQQLLQTLKQRYQCEIEMEIKVRPELIGGLVLHIGDRVIDGSIKGHLGRMHEQLRA